RGANRPKPQDKRDGDNQSKKAWLSQSLGLESAGATSIRYGSNQAIFLQREWIDFLCFDHEVDRGEPQTERVLSDSKKVLGFIEMSFLDFSLNLTRCAGIFVLQCIGDGP
ncbi:MAG: hypothetical protein C4294_03945, partial [Nitrospiraceae bacterium]